MVNPVIIRELIDKADEDFKFAEVNLKERGNFLAPICFHFHQAAEKYLKTFIVAFELEFKKIHNLFHLFEICRDREPSLENIREDCKLLNRFYIDTRYPVHWPTHYTMDEGEKAYNAASQIRNFVKMLLVDFLK
ncbi:MAG: HEPN domain-containing protein [Deltaproteobacteria bacterium]|nr:HEPN domain-containing protein [Deltaproteobacteria bacterium]